MVTRVSTLCDFTHLLYTNKAQTFCPKAAMHIWISVHTWFSKIQGQNLIKLVIFPCFYEFASQDTWKTWQTQLNTLDNRRLQLVCSVLYLVHPKTKFHNFILNNDCGRLNFDTCVIQKKNVFKSGLPICHRLWDTDFCFVWFV